MKNYSIPRELQILDITEVGNFANNNSSNLSLHADIGIYIVTIKIKFDTEILFEYVDQIRKLTKGKLPINSRLIYGFVVNVIIKNISNHDNQLN